MDEGGSRPWLIVLVLLFMAAYIALTETAFASVSRNRIKVRAEKGDSRASRALKILDNFDLAISTLLIANNIVHLATASLVTVTVTRLFGLSYVSISTLVTTLVVFFVGEMLPKSIAKKYAETFTLTCALPLDILMFILAPLAKLLTFIGEKAAKLSKGDGEISVTEDEIYDIIDGMQEEGSLKPEEGELIASALQFSYVSVESIITPRVDVVAIDIEDDNETILKTIKEVNHSRLPVYEGSIDNIIGILQIRKFLKAYLQNKENLRLRELLDEALFVHQSTNISELLPAMNEKRLNMAVVSDNYGGTLGIITVENILEELVGDIWDEDDEIEEGFVKLDEKSCLVEADEIVDDVFEYFDYEDPEDNEDLVDKLMGEWVYEHFTNIPDVGDSFRYHDLVIEVYEKEANRILKLKVNYDEEVKEEMEDE